MAGAVLAVVDRCLLIAIPLLVATVVLGQPALAAMWIATGLGLFAVVIVLSRGQAPWRGGAYALLALAAAIVGLWSVGPLTGIGVLFGVAILLASAFLPPRWLALTLVGSAATITARVIVGCAPHSRLVATLSLWLATAVAAAALMWIAIRFLAALMASLELSYANAASALAIELASQDKLERSRSELEELAQVEMVGRLAGGVAHDVNNALASILAAAEMLAAEVTTPAQRRDLAELEAASLHAGDLVRDLLWTGRRFPAPTKTHAELGTIVRACLERVGRIARKIEVVHQLDPAIELAIAPEHLEQILFGVIVNLDRLGVARLAITSARSDQFNVVSLEGDIAMPTTAARLVQIRLGISAARALVTSYGGEQTMIESAARIRIDLRLPIRENIVVDVVRVNVPLRTALVVEDEPMVLRRLCKLVAQRGYEVKAASSVAEAMTLLAGRPDLLITDMQLPDGSGRDVALAAYGAESTAPDHRVLRFYRRRYARRIVAARRADVSRQTLHERRLRSGVERAVTIAETLRTRIRRGVDLAIFVGTFALLLIAIVDLARGTSKEPIIAIAATFALASCSLFGLLGRAPWTPVAYIALILLVNVVYLTSYGPWFGLGTAYIFATAVAFLFVPRWAWVVVGALVVTPIAIGVAIACGVLSPPVVALDDVNAWWRGASGSLTCQFGVAVVVGYAVNQLIRERRQIELALIHERDRQVESSRIEADLASARRADSIAQLAAEVGADIGNALAIVQARAAALVRELHSDDAVDCLGDIREASEAAAGTVRSLTAFGPDAKLALRGDAAHAVRELPKLVRRVIPTRITLDVIVEGEAWVGVETTDLSRIFANLVLNARDAIADTGVITVRLERRAGTVVVDVRDSGAGMSTETIGQLFRPFFTTKAIGRGTGLGLATTKILVERSGGTIEVASELGRRHHVHDPLARGGLSLRPGCSRPSCESSCPKLYA